MSFSAPTPPDPTATSNTQQQYNTTAAQTQNQTNSYNQSNPYGSMTYAADPNSPSGYTLNTSLSAPNQGLLNTQFGNQGTAGQTAGSLFNTAGNLASNAAGMYSQPYDLNAASEATAKNLNSWQQAYNQPIFDQQSSNLEAQLRNQGLAPGTEAYNNAKNLLARNQGDVTNQYLTQNQGQAYSQALQSYQTPLQTVGGLLGEATGAGAYAQPTGPTFANTPTAQIQPANYQGAVASNYAGQVANNNAMWNGIGQLGGAAVNLATGGGVGNLSGMFNSATNGMFQSNPYNSMPKIGGGWG